VLLNCAPLLQRDYQIQRDYQLDDAATAAASAIEEEANAVRVAMVIGTAFLRQTPAGTLSGEGNSTLTLQFPDS
jgi:hypothetical protein